MFEIKLNGITKAIGDYVAVFAEIKRTSKLWDLTDFVVVAHAQKKARENE